MSAPQRSHFAGGSGPALGRLFNAETTGVTTGGFGGMESGMHGNDTFVSYFDSLRPCPIAMPLS